MFILYYVYTTLGVNADGLHEIRNDRGYVKNDGWFRIISNKKSHYVFAIN